MLEWLNRLVSPPPDAGFRQRRKKPLTNNVFCLYFKSLVKNKNYIGSTENLNKRLNYHNSGKVKSTKAFKPWKIIYFEKFDSKAEALRREKQIKSYKGYILKSLSKNKYYIGSTEDLTNRLNYHNSGKVRSTKAFRPWEIIYFEKRNTKSEALKREKQIKSYKGGNAFKKLIDEI